MEAAPAAPASRPADTRGVYQDLMALTIALANERQVETLMAHVIEAALRLSNAEGAAIFTLDRLARHLHRVSFNYRGITSITQPDTRIAIYDPALTPNLREPAAFTIATGTHVNIAEIDNAPGYDFSNIRLMDKALGFRTRSLVIVPLVVFVLFVRAYLANQLETQYLNHTAPTIAYRISADGATVAYVTDHEPFWHSPGRAPHHPGDHRHIDFLRGADLVIHDAQYTSEEYRSKLGWGHSPTDYVTDVAMEAGVRRLALFHHDPGHDDDAIKHMEDTQRARGSQPVACRLHPGGLCTPRRAGVAHQRSIGSRVR